MAAPADTTTMTEELNSLKKELEEKEAVLNEQSLACRQPIYICPFYKRIMRDPVSVSSGVTYERNALIEWEQYCKDNNQLVLDPVNQLSYNTDSLTPNTSLRDIIKDAFPLIAEIDSIKAKIERIEKKLAESQVNAAQSSSSTYPGIVLSLSSSSASEQHQGTYARLPESTTPPGNSASSAVAIPHNQTEDNNRGSILCGLIALLAAAGLGYVTVAAGIDASNGKTCHVADDHISCSAVTTWGYVIMFGLMTLGIGFSGVKAIVQEIRHLYNNVPAADVNAAPASASVSTSDPEGVPLLAVSVESRDSASSGDPSPSNQTDQSPAFPQP